MDWLNTNNTIRLLFNDRMREIPHVYIPISLIFIGNIFNLNIFTTYDQLFVSLQSRKVILETDEGLISENVVSDPTGQTLLVTVGDVSMTEHFVSTVNLHDLSTVSFYPLK